MHILLLRGHPIMHQRMVCVQVTCVARRARPATGARAMLAVTCTAPLRVLHGVEDAAAQQYMHARIPSDKSHLGGAADEKHILCGLGLLQGQGPLANLLDEVHVAVGPHPRIEGLILRNARRHLRSGLLLRSTHYTDAARPRRGSLPHPLRALSQQGRQSARDPSKNNPLKRLHPESCVVLWWTPRSEMTVESCLRSCERW